ncbi:very short patch repair endonuclease [bacterium]|nr:very short patch repair endonuclease [bacterium]
MDTVSPAKRSRIMASVKSSGNKSTEAVLATMLRKEHLSGWRRNYPLVGKPDFVFPASQLAIFVDGCFWHGCPKHCRMPADNRGYWNQKISRNVERDRGINKQLHGKGWSVVRFWEHDLCGGQGLTRKMRRMKEIAQQGKCSVRDKPRR